MSFYMATCFADRVEMLTDGAGYDGDGVLRRLERKVTLVPGHRVAITSRGHVGWGKKIAAGLTEAILRGGLDAAMLVFGAMLPGMARQMPPGQSSDVCVAGFSEADGPIVYYFRTADEPGFVEGWKLYSTRKTVVCGITHERAVGHIHAPIAAAGTLRDGGVRLMEIMRREKGINADGLTAAAYIIGGFIDLTTISAAGVQTERIHTWPDDRIGEKINPFAGTNVTSLKATGMNRQQRRAAVREAKKLRA
jgi:hypothetical protein